MYIDSATEFITYGHFLRRDKFSRACTSPTKAWINKPHGGVWSSPVNSKWGWKDWSLAEEFRTESLKKYTKFRLRSGSRVYMIDNPGDLKELLCKYPLECSDGGIRIDFTAMIRDGWDGIWLTEEGQSLTRWWDEPPYTNLYGWDVETMLIFNWSALIIIEKGWL